LLPGPPPPPRWCNVSDIEEQLDPSSDRCVMNAEQQSDLREVVAIVFVQPDGTPAKVLVVDTIRPTDPEQ
jgi:hypothetical protein